MVGGVELAVLAGEVLVVEVQPVVLLQLAAQYLLVPHARVGDLRVLERQRDGVVPRRGVARDVDGDLGRLLQHDGLHVVVCDLGTHSRLVGPAHGLDRHAAQVGLTLGGCIVLQEERAAAVVELPLALLPARQHPVGQPVSAQVVGLSLVHGYEPAGARRRGGSGSREREAERQRHDDRPRLDHLRVGAIARPAGVAARARCRARVRRGRAGVRRGRAGVGRGRAGVRRGRASIPRCRAAPCRPPPRAHPRAQQQREPQRHDRGERDHQPGEHGADQAHRPDGPHARARDHAAHAKQACASHQNRRSRRSDSSFLRTSGAFHDLG